MSNEEHNVYMRNVKWTTALYVLVSTISIIISIVWFAAGVKGDIKDLSKDVRSNREEAHNELVLAVTHIKIYVDSNFTVRDKRIEENHEAITTPRHQGYYIEYRDPITGKIKTKPAN